MTYPRALHLCFCLLSALALGSCIRTVENSAIASPSSQTGGAPDSNSADSTLAPGLASISGTLYSYTVDQFIPETLFYVTPALGEENDLMPPVIIGPQDDKGDIRGFTDINGNLKLVNLKPGNYYLIVWAPPYNWEPVVESSELSTPLLIHLEAGDEVEYGTLYVSWP